MILSKLSQKILLFVFFLSGLGLVQVYSSSYIFATENFEKGLLFFNKQFAFMLIGFALLFLMTYLSWAHVRLIGISLWVFSVFGLILTLIPELSVTAGGSQRWVEMPFGLRFQPSEWFKAACPFAFIYFMALKEKWPLHIGLYWLISIFAFSLPILILMLQPDFGSVLLFLSLVFSLFFILGLKWRYTAGVFCALSAGAYLFIVNSSYRMERVQAFLDPWQDPLGSGFQVIQSLISFHSGGLAGQGLGQGQGKLFFLPEAHTDFTLAVLGEEMGFIGFVLFLFLYGGLGYCGLQVISRTTDLSQKIVVFSSIFLFLISTLIHTGVNLGVLPPTGLVLPFLSYGGNALVCTLLSFGWVIHIENANVS